ncbi:MAG TPA: helix-turn-helix transcriptional regulator [Paracoccaceae bacterium]|nr:helix-turn-helix transcriptional regulator [Paracoccaceae bacterium]HMO70147.1 helix-turn-helix transcriptional regulator [Paracoccaceae bacterium]
MEDWLTAPAPGLPDLAPRQREIMERVCPGQSNRRIGPDLGISEGTVKIRVAAILRILGAANRSEAVARWFGAAAG